MKQVIILSGAIGAGKTTVCAKVIESVRATQQRVAGVLSPAETMDSEKVGIWIEDLASGERRRLAVAAHIQREGDVMTKDWTFDGTVLDWAASVIAQACPCHLLVIDELGPLELERDEGWQIAFDVLRNGSYSWAIVIVRARLVDAMKARLAGVATQAVMVNPANRDALPGQIASWII